MTNSLEVLKSFFAYSRGRTHEHEGSIEIVKNETIKINSKKMEQRI